MTDAIRKLREAVRCWFGLCMKPTGVWHYSATDAGTVWTCRCGRSEDRPGDCTGFEMGLKEKTDERA